MYMYMCMSILYTKVECELQSRLSHAEAERRRVAGQLEALGNTLKKERDGHYRDKEALM